MTSVGIENMKNGGIRIALFAVYLTLGFVFTEFFTREAYNGTLIPVALLCSWGAFPALATPMQTWPQATWLVTLGAPLLYMSLLFILLAVARHIAGGRGYLAVLGAHALGIYITLSKTPRLVAASSHCPAFWVITALVVSISVAVAWFVLDWTLGRHPNNES